jgi:hypothetical protein
VSDVTASGPVRITFLPGGMGVTDEGVSYFAEGFADDQRCQGRLIAAFAIDAEDVEQAAHAAREY